MTQGLHDEEIEGVADSAGEVSLLVVEEQADGGADCVLANRHDVVAADDAVVVQAVSWADC